MNLEAIARSESASREGPRQCDSTRMRSLVIVRPLETESKIGGAGGWGMRGWELGFRGTELQFGEEGKVLDADSGDGQFTTV